MKRRTLLLSTGALALMSMLPRSVVALAPAHPEYDLPIRTLGVIEQALDAAVQWNFAPAERSLLFGVVPLDNGREEVGQLRDRVTSLIVEFDDLSAWNRARFLAAIQERLNERFPGDFAAQMKWLDERQFIFSEASARKYMPSTPFSVARLLDPKIGYHGFAEMRAFG